MGAGWQKWWRDEPDRDAWEVRNEPARKVVWPERPTLSLRGCFVQRQGERVALAEFDPPITLDQAAVVKITIGADNGMTATILHGEERHG